LKKYLIIFGGLGYIVFIHKRLCCAQLQVFHTFEKKYYKTDIMIFSTRHLENNSIFDFNDISLSPVHMHKHLGVRVLVVQVYLTEVQAETFFT
jgi:hypothetical protein